MSPNFCNTGTLRLKIVAIDALGLRRKKIAVLGARDDDGTSRID
jgi:hypothetical protein